MEMLHIAASPLTGTIFCGRVLKDGRTWGANKTDLTIEALIAVAKHALHFKKESGEDIVITTSCGVPEYKIVVERL